MLIAPPRERVKKASVLHIELRGEISDQLQGSFSSRLSLPKISENFLKATYDPEIAGIYLEIEPLACAWLKLMKFVDTFDLPVKLRKHRQVFKILQLNSSNLAWQRGYLGV